MKAERQKITSLPLCYHCPWWRKTAAATATFVILPTLTPISSGDYHTDLSSPPADYIFLPLKHNLQHNHTAQFGDTLPPSGRRRAGRRGAER